MRTVLHAGSGGEPLPEYLSEYEETRLDINPDCKPDILASVTEIGDVGQFDVVYCSHVLEHLYWHEVDKALSEFYRVLKPGGSLVAVCPDTEGIQATEYVLFIAPAGPITGIDLLWGFRPSIKNGNSYMAHKCGFVKDTLKKKIEAAGFKDVVCNRLSWNNLMAGGAK